MNIAYPAPTVRKVVKVYNFKQMDDITSEHLLNLSTPKLATNIHISGGKITTGLGITGAKFKFDNEEIVLSKAPEDSLKQVFVYHNFDRVKQVEDNYIIVRTTVGNFYKTKIVSNNKWEKIEGLHTRQMTEGVNYRYENKDVMLFSSSDMSLKMYDGTTVTEINSAPKLNSMASHYGRVFLSTLGEGDVWFSDDYNPLNWNVSLQEAGYIKFNDSFGRTLKVISFRDYLYIFREYGIYRLQAIGDQQNFELSLVTELGSKIFKDSIQVVDNTIMFLTGEGLYIFDGYSLKKVQLDIEMLQNVKETGIVSGYFNHKYLVALNNPNFTQINDLEPNNNCILSYDLSTGKAEFSSGFIVLSLAPIKMHGTANCFVLLDMINTGEIGMFDYCGKAQFNDLACHFETIKYGFGNFDKDKYIRDLKLISKYDTTIWLKTSNGERVQKVKGSDNVITLKIMEKTKFIKLKFICKGKIDIGGFEIIFDEVK